MKSITLTAPLLLLLAACADVEGDDHDHDHHDHEHEVVTTISLTFTSQTDGSAFEAVWADPENDGSPVIDDIFLLDGDAYDVSLGILNELEEPAEDVTPEISDESEEHQFFFTGSAVEGPATGANDAAVVAHAYADLDENGLPIGLSNTFTTLAIGAGELTVTLRHMPPESDQAVKVEGLAETVAESGFGSIGGANDIEVTFNLEVE